MNDKAKLKNTIIKWSLYGALMIATILVFAFSANIFGIKNGIDDAGEIIWNPKAVFNQKVSDVPFLQYMFEHAIPNTLRTIQIAGIAVTFAIALHYFAKIVFTGKKAKTISRLVVSFLKWVIALCAVFFTMDAWGADTTTMLASAGVLTLIIGLGSQSLVADILAGIFIVFEGEFQVGDIVVIDSWRGEVKEIGIRTTKLVDAGGNIKIVNNSEIKTIINQTQELSVAKTYVSVSYNVRLEKVEAAFADALPGIKEKIPAIVEGPYYKGVSELGESGVTLLFIAKCKEDDIYQVNRDLNRAIKIMFDDSGIEIPFNQLVVHMADEEAPEQKLTQAEAKKADSFNQEQQELSKNINEDL